MSETVKNKFIGSGIIFPIELDLKSGKPVVYSGDLKLIRSSIGIILNWPVAHRWFNGEFGCRIEEVLEEPDDSISRTLVRQFITESLAKWEKRIILNSVELDYIYSRGVINCLLNYTIRNSKIEETVIFPFYKELTY